MIMKIRAVYRITTEDVLNQVLEDWSIWKLIQKIRQMIGHILNNKVLLKIIVEHLEGKIPKSRHMGHL